jgi:AcrR family transcriptional regulator
VTVGDVGTCDDAARRPGRPRSAEADRAILDAAIAEYGARGLDGLTVDAVAARAGVSKATIYRRYPGKADLVIAAAHAGADAGVPKDDTGDVANDVRSVLAHLQSVMRDALVGAVGRMLIADAARDEQIRRLHHEFVRHRRAGTVAMLDAAKARGDLRADMDASVATDQLVGPVFYRFLVSGDPIDDAYLDALADVFLRAYRNG